MDRLVDLLPLLWESTLGTLYVVGLALVFGGLAGLVLGLAIYVTRPSGILANQPAAMVLNFVVNTFRPIPFIIFVGAAQPLARLVVGSGIGNNAIAFMLSILAAFGISRIVEQNLIAVDVGVIEAARSVGAGPLRIIATVLLPEALGPLILGYTFVVIAIIDMSVVGGYIAGEGLGTYAIVYGYNQYNPFVTWAAVIVIIIIVQVVQLLGNALARKVLRR